jgi:hypothetical protein
MTTFTTKECCNHNCNQGRNCPLRKKILTDEEILVFEDANGNELKVDTGKWNLRKAQEK